MGLTASYGRPSARKPPLMDKQTRFCSFDLGPTLGHTGPGTRAFGDESRRWRHVGKLVTLTLMRFGAKCEENVRFSCFVFVYVYVCVCVFEGGSSSGMFVKSFVDGCRVDGF